MGIYTKINVAFYILLPVLRRPAWKKKVTEHYVGATWRRTSKARVVSEAKPNSLRIMWQLRGNVVPRKNHHDNLWKVSLDANFKYGFKFKRLHRANLPYQHFQRRHQAPEVMLAYLNVWIWWVSEWVMSSQAAEYGERHSPTSAVLNGHKANFTMQTKNISKTTISSCQPSWYFVSYLNISDVARRHRHSDI